MTNVHEKSGLLVQDGNVATTTARDDDIVISTTTTTKAAAAVDWSELH